MSENSSSAKTEQPTPKKIRDSREKGQVSKSKEVVSTTLILGTFALLYGFSDYFIEHIKNIILLPGDYAYQSFDVALNDVVEASINELMWIIIPFSLFTVVLVVAAHLIQFGFVFSAESLKPEFKKINPVEGAKKIFSIKSLVEFIKSIFKVILLTVLIWWVLVGNLHDLMRMSVCGLSCIIPITGKLLFELMLIAGLGFIIISAIDYAFENYQHTKELKMTKDEVKREHKEMEGSPEIKNKRKQLHQEIQASNAQDDVDRSSVLVTNPTHIAIGIYYKKEETPLPVITVKSQGKLALRLIEYAKEKEIPVIQRVPLARALHAEAEVNHYIPSELIQPVAEVLRWLKTIEDKE